MPYSGQASLENAKDKGILLGSRPRKADGL
jgi:hypothetical protein